MLHSQPNDVLTPWARLRCADLLCLCLCLCLCPASVAVSVSDMDGVCCCALVRTWAAVRGALLPSDLLRTRA
eukprot:372408-Rhodomonas_salina.1